MKPNAVQHKDDSHMSVSNSIKDLLTKAKDLVVGELQTENDEQGMERERMYIDILDALEALRDWAEA